ncbi:hypothetical protein FQN49_000454 [Arthroderma sp. PD_2]|nr:hypothetical protein FQN49_000454 [Arthroderma sp. PD_2]
MSQFPPCITVHQSFKERLPRLNLAPVPNGYRTFHPSAPSTQVIVAPRALFIDRVETLQSRVRSFVENTQTGGYLRSQMPLVESTFFLESEEDVIRASLAHLIYPREDGGRVSDRIIWTHSGPNGPVHIAILEMKNTRTIHSQEFYNARATAGNRVVKFAEAGRRAGLSLLANNAYTLSQQATKYHQATGVVDIAMFDWNEMVVLDFTGVSNDPANPQFPHAILFSESTQPYGGPTFRSVLLAFLMRALARQGVFP